MLDFTELLNKPAEEFKAPPATPEGVYELVIESPGFKQEKRNTKNGERGVIVIEAKVAAPKTVYNPDEEEAAYKAVNRKLTLDFWVDEDSIYRLTNFLTKTLGLDGTQPIGVLLNEISGQAFLGEIKQETFTTKAGEEGIASRIKQTMPV